MTCMTWHDTILYYIILYYIIYFLFVLFCFISYHIISYYIILYYIILYYIYIIWCDMIWYDMKTDLQESLNLGNKTLSHFLWSLGSQICFELVDPLLISKMVTKATYYTKIDSLPKFDKPAITENVPAMTIWLDDTLRTRKYEFQCAKSDEYTPHTGFTLYNVRYVVLPFNVELYCILCLR